MRTIPDCCEGSYHPTPGVSAGKVTPANTKSNQGPASKPTIKSQPKSSPSGQDSHK